MATLSESTVRALILVHWPMGSMTMLGDSGISLSQLLLEIVRLESGFDPLEVGDGGESDGLFQIHWPSWGDQLVADGIIFTRMQLKDANTNVRVARYVYDHSEPEISPFHALHPWSTRDQAAKNVSGEDVEIDLDSLESPSVIDQAIGGIVGDWTSGLGKFFSVLTSVSFWKAVGLGALAFVLIIVGVVIFSKSGVQ